VAVVLLRAPDADVGLQLDRHRQHDTRLECLSVARGHGQAVLRVERVVEGAAEGGQVDSNSASEPGWRGGRSPSTPARWPRPYPTIRHKSTPITYQSP